MNTSILKKRNLLIKTIRNYFDNLGYLEVDTPVLALSCIPESNIELFTTEYLDPYGNTRSLSLLPSPEYYMKKLLAADMGSIYQICKSFRNSESLSHIHNIEFTMLEWYTVGKDYIHAMDLTEDLYFNLCKSLDPRTPKYSFSKYSLEEAFTKFAGFSLKKALLEGSLRKHAEEAGIMTTDSDSDEDLFHKVLIEKIEPEILPLGPVFLYDYPKLVPTLAEDKNELWSQRWELYINGIEIANCYTEERSKDKMNSFFFEESEKKAHALVPASFDWRWPEEIGESLPLCSGAALGVDRLIMAVLGINAIEGVILFPFSDILESK
ncbi:MAG: amino acid--tRNA ligase-related protein [Spirochaetia bacterium]